MKRKIRGSIFLMLLFSVVVFLDACGEKHTFQVSALEKPYTNVKLASVREEEDVVLDEGDTKECMSVFDDLVFVQTQSGGNFTDKAYSLIFLDGETPVDSMQISEDGKTIAYGGFFYQLEEESYDIEVILNCFEKQKLLNEEQKKQEEMQQAKEVSEQETETESESESETVGTKEEENGQTGEIFAEDEFDGQFPGESKIIAVHGGCSCAVDLDGDGNKEEILYEVQSFDGIHSEVLFLVQTVSENGEPEYAAAWRNDEALPFADLVNPCADAYYLTDLDSTDSGYEVVILDYGESADPVYHFIRYEAGELVYLGEVPSDSTPAVKGDGTVIASGRLSVLQSWNAPFTWVLENERLEHPEEEWYYPYVNAVMQEKTRQVKPVVVYAEPEPEAEQRIVEPSEEVISFGTTDNKNWVQFFRSDGVSGWIYLKDGNYLEVDGVEYHDSEVFENLYYVG